MVFIVIACPTQLLAMVLKLYGWFASGPALVAALILHEKNIPFEWVDVDITAGESKSEDYLAKFPFGLVPAIVSRQKPHITIKISTDLWIHRTTMG